MYNMFIVILDDPVVNLKSDRSSSVPNGKKRTGTRSSTPGSTQISQCKVGVNVGMSVSKRFQKWLDTDNQSRDGKI